MAPFVPRDWRNATGATGGGDETTPLNAAALEDLEDRVTDYTDIRSPFVTVLGGNTSDDTADVQNAITEATALGRACLAFNPTKTYTITSVLAIPTKISVDGFGGAKIKIAAGTTRDSRIFALAAASASDLTIRGIELDGNGANFTTTSFLGGLIQGHNNSKRIRIEDVYMHDAFGYLINLSSTVNTLSEDWWIEDVYADGSGMQGGAHPGFFMHNIKGCRIQNCKVKNTGDDNIAFISQRAYSGGSPATQFCSDYSVVDCTLETVKVTGSNLAMTGVNGTARGLTCRGHKSSGGATGTDGAVRIRHSDVDTNEFIARDMHVEDVDVYSALGPGVSLNACRSTVRDYRVHDPDGMGAFVSVSAAAIASGEADAVPDDLGHVLLDNFEVYSASQEGIKLSNFAGRFRLKGGRAESGASIGARLDLPTTAGQVKELDLEGFNAINNTGDGVQIGATNGRADIVSLRAMSSRGNTGWGIQFIDSGLVIATRLDIVDNPNVAGNTAGQWDIPSVVIPTVVSGSPTLTSNVATPSVPATDVALTNPYGIPATVYVTGGTVTQIYVDAQTLGLISGGFYVSSRGTIKLTYSAAPTWKWILEP